MIYNSNNKAMLIGFMLKFCEKKIAIYPVLFRLA